MVIEAGNKSKAKSLSLEYQPQFVLCNFGNKVSFKSSETAHSKTHQDIAVIQSEFQYEAF
jgi:hypothetical protein